MTAETRIKQIAQIWSDNRWLYIFCGWIIGLITLPALSQLNNNFRLVVESIIPNTIAIIFAGFLLNRLARQREIKSLKQRLKIFARSRDNAVTSSAIDEIRANGWLVGDDGILAGVDLDQANLSKVDLSKANLKYASLIKANFQEVYTFGPNMQGAYLHEAQFQNATLVGVDMSHVRMGNANLQDTYLEQVSLLRAYLWQSNFENAKAWGVNFRQANLQDVNFQNTFLAYKNYKGEISEAQFDEWTTLPDGTRYIPDLGIKQLARFGAIVEPLTHEEIKEHQNAILAENS